MMNEKASWLFINEIFFVIKGRITNSKNKNDRINDRINGIDEDIISCIKDNKYITTSELATLLNKSLPTIQRHINNLVKAKKVERIGARKTGYWQILDD